MAESDTLSCVLVLYDQVGAGSDPYIASRFGSSFVGALQASFDPVPKSEIEQVSMGCCDLRHIWVKLFHFLGGSIKGNQQK